MDEKILCLKCGKACMLDVLIIDNKIMDIKNHHCNKAIPFIDEVALQDKRFVTYFMKIKDMAPTFQRVITNIKLEKDKITDFVYKLKEHEELVKPYDEGELIISNFNNTNIDIMSLGTFVKQKKK